MFVVGDLFITEMFMEPSPRARHHAGLWLRGVGGGDPHGIAIDSSYDWLLDTCELVPVAQKAARVTVLERVALHFLDVGSGWVVGNDAPVTRGNC